MPDEFIGRLRKHIVIEISKGVLSVRFFEDWDDHDSLGVLLERAR
jgi:hypothetical protein